MPALGFELRDCQAWRDAGMPISTTSNQAAKLYDASISQMFGWTNDETLGGIEGTMNGALQEDPNFVLGHVLGCYTNITFAEGRGLRKMEATLKETQKVIDLANRSELNHREKLYVEALKHLVNGNNMKASLVWDDILVSYPTDRLALHMTFHNYLHAGEMERMRNASARAFPFWKKEMRQYGFMCGTMAFGLEETKNYAEAEKLAKLACEIDRRDPWSRHCLSHVYEMIGKPDEGIKNVKSSEKDWTYYGGLVGHNYWHWSLFHLEKGEYEEALGIYDTKFDTKSTTGRFGWLGCCDASSLLQRLQFEGVDLGSRWDDLFEKSRPYLEDPEHFWTFVDGHLMVAACHNPKNTDISKKFLESAKKFVREQTGDHRNVMQTIGVPLMESMREYQEGNYEKSVDILYPVRYEIQNMGGSDAQRDLFHLYLINAAMKSPNENHRKLSRSLVAERMSLQEDSPLNERWMARAVAAH